MLIKTEKTIPASEITGQSQFLSRRKFIWAAAGTAAAGLAGGLLSGPVHAAGGEYADVPRGPYSAQLPVTDFDYVANYTNYYEFTTNKEDSTRLAKALPVSPWSVTVEGEVDKKGVFHLEDLLKQHPLQERVYRFRCVEAWSMVVPWIGFPLGDLLKSLQPTSRARYVQFTTLYKPDVMPGQRSSVLDWPYVEGLRIDEAMHPLTLLVTGMYDDPLPKQNGAPLRLIVPWKYGFKSIKAIVRIRLQETMPKTAWNMSAPGEYGFYANVNPLVPHPRWSQRTERVLGGSIFTPKRKTELFNGYSEQVAKLYAGMDLKKYF